MIHELSTKARDPRHVLKEGGLSLLASDLHLGWPRPLLGRGTTTLQERTSPLRFLYGLLPLHSREDCHPEGKKGNQLGSVPRRSDM